MNEDVDMRDLIARDLMREQEADRLRLAVDKNTHPKIVGEESYDPMDDVTAREKKLEEAHQKRLAALSAKNVPPSKEQRAAFHSTPAAEASARRRAEFDEAERKIREKRQKEIDDILGL